MKVFNYILTLSLLTLILVPAVNAWQTDTNNYGCSATASGYIDFDDFNRADSTDLGETVVGTDWVESTDVATIKGGALVVTANAAYPQIVFTNPASDTMSMLLEFQINLSGAGAVNLEFRDATVPVETIRSGQPAANQLGAYDGSNFKSLNMTTEPYSVYLLNYTKISSARSFSYTIHKIVDNQSNTLDPPQLMATGTGQSRATGVPISLQVAQDSAGKTTTYDNLRLYNGATCPAPRTIHYPTEPDGSACSTDNDEYVLLDSYTDPDGTLIQNHNPEQAINISKAYTSTGDWEIQSNAGFGDADGKNFKLTPIRKHTNITMELWRYHTDNANAFSDMRSSGGGEDGCQLSYSCGNDCVTLRSLSGDKSFTASTGLSGAFDSSRFHRIRITHDNQTDKCHYWVWQDDVLKLNYSIAPLAASTSISEFQFYSTNSAGNPSGIDNLTVWEGSNCPAAAADVTAPTISGEKNWTNDDLTFTMSAQSSETGQCTLYGNWTGSWAQNETQAVTAATQFNWTAITLPGSNNYLWGANCSDASGNEAFAVNNTFNTADVTAPTISNEVNYTNDGLEFIMSAQSSETGQCTLYGNWTGSWSQNESKSVTAATAFNWSSVTLAGHSNYLWGANCSDSAGNEAFAVNSTFDTVNTAPTTPLITSPVNLTHVAVDSIDLVFNSTDADGDLLTYSIYMNDSFMANQTTDETISFTGLLDGRYNFTIQVSDGRAAAISSDYYIFTVDTTQPQINFISPLADNSTLTNTTAYEIVVDVNDTYLDLTNVTITNSSGVTIYTNLTNWTGGETDVTLRDIITLSGDQTYNVEVCARDSDSDSPKIDDYTDLSKVKDGQSFIDYITNTETGTTIKRTTTIRNKQDNVVDIDFYGLNVVDYWTDGGKHLKTDIESNKLSGNDWSYHIYYECTAGCNSIRYLTNNNRPRLIDDNYNFMAHYRDAEAEGWQIDMGTEGALGWVRISYPNDAFYQSLGSNYTIDPIIAGLNSGCKTSQITLDTTAPTVSNVEFYAINGSNGVTLGGRDQFNLTNLVDIEKVRINFTITDANNFDAIKLHFTANGTNGCATGNKQRNTCYTWDDGLWITWQDGVNTSTFNDIGASGDRIDCTFVESGTTRNYSCLLDEHYNPNIIKAYPLDFNFPKYQTGATVRISNNKQWRINVTSNNLPTDADFYKLDFRVSANNGSGVLPTQPLNAYMCNSTYQTGDPGASSACTLTGSKTPNQFGDDGTKYRVRFNKDIINDLGTLDWVVLTSEENAANSYYSMKTYPHIGTDSIIAFTSNNGGVSYTRLDDNNYETDLNINWFYNKTGSNKTGFVFRVETADTSANIVNSSDYTLEWDFEGTGFPDLAPINTITEPSVGDDLTSSPATVSWSASSPDSDFIVSNLSYVYSGTETLLVENRLVANTNYSWDISSLTNGAYTVRLKTCENSTALRQCSVSENNITITIPADDSGSPGGGGGGSGIPQGETDAEQTVYPPSEDTVPGEDLFRSFAKWLQDTGAKVYPSQPATGTAIVSLSLLALVSFLMSGSQSAGSNLFATKKRRGR